MVFKELTTLIQVQPVRNARSGRFIPVIWLKRQKGQDFYFVEANEIYVVRVRRKIGLSMRQHNGKD